jgi:hypothetical protein
MRSGLVSSDIRHWPFFPNFIDFFARFFVFQDVAQTDRRRF